MTPDGPDLPDESRAGDEDGGGSEAPARPPGRRRRTVALVALLAAVAGGSAIVLAARGGDCPPAGAALEVAGETVTVDALERRVELLEALYGLTPPPASDEEKSDAFLRDLAKSMAVALIIDAEVDDRDLPVAERAVRDALDRYIADRYGDGGRAAFVRSLGDQGVNEAEVLAEFRRLLETRRLFDAVTGDLEVSAAEVEAAFGERRDELAIQERRTLRHLVVATLDEARVALDRLRGGEDFAAVAADVSLDAATKDAGGELGSLTKAELAPPFAEAAFAAEPGTPFGPVETDLGFHVGVVEDVTPGRPRTLEEVREPLREQLVGERRLARWRGFLGERIAAADACYADRYLPSDPEAPPPDLTGDPAQTTPTTGS